ncbi:ochratoxin A non-ribosomal peptide synthetase [Delitschia confertaspora ATCC 74209]|uniref:Ochratoxin A non-ribosomal peptide synthetase n=1 Tax=Delitschia confertaspora ATCC 74209 TaxID=1513339 RepID=A0A9P4MUJ4_9PLEO|nr:ochratoxin A non-ribosomal peptide synthetase [Delitschia confertaspora ATCC 74209]
MSATPNSSILLPHIIHHNAQSDPNGIFAQIPAGPKYTDGYKTVTKLQFHNAINHTASLIKQNLGDSKRFETLAYIGPGDLRYSILVVAGIKSGYKVFLPSPRNSQEAHISLLQKLQCTKLIVTEPQAPCIPPILSALNLQTMTLPSLTQLLEADNVEEYPYEKSFEEARADPAFVLHTSGSTGIPKQLTFTNEFVSRVIAACSLSPPEGYVDINRYFVTGKFFMTLPSFHIAGLAYSLLISAYHGSIPVYPLPGPPPTVESFISAINNTNIDWAFVPPVVIDELGKNPDHLSTVAARLKYLFFTGGSVPKTSGDIVASKLPIWQVLGSSECASLPLVHAEKGYENKHDWNYLQLNPLLKSEMRYRLDNLYELVIVKNDETEAFQPAFAHFTQAAEYETRDLFRPHPEKEGLWAYQSRIDDVIVFLNGEKTNPVSFEEEVISHPEVRAALVVGAQRLEAALLVELTTDAVLSEKEKAAVVDRIWPVVEKANKAAPAHAFVAKSRILLVDPNVPMLRAGKGTVQRNATLALYAGEIDKLYQQDDALAAGGTELSTVTNIKSVIRDLVADMLGLDHLDFFQLGMDSLGVLRLQRALKSRFPGVDISPNTVYANSSVNALAKALEKPPTANEETAANGDHSSEGMAKLLEDFSKEIDGITRVTRSEAPAPDEKGKVILLTGSTGALGSYVLDHLLSMADVAHIYCFNRTSDAKDRQIKNHQIRDLTTDFPSERITFLAGDLSKPNFGLQESNYITLLEEITHIMHNAWPVNFNLSLSAFKSSLSGVVSLIRFSAHSRLNSKIQFFSSISSVSSYSGSIVPETVVTELSAPAGTGYGQSKYLAEQLLEHASKTLGIGTSVVRIGQVAGAARTASGWNRQEWLPSLVTSSGFIGALPETLGDIPTDWEETVNWVPIDQLANVVVELALDSHATNRDDDTNRDTSVFQIVHPNPVSWSSVLTPVKKILQESSSSSQVPIKIVPYADWLSTLKAMSIEAETVGSVDAETIARKNPAMKLLEFYETLQEQGNRGLRTKLSMEKTMGSSKALRELEPLRDEWITGWVKEWIRT